MHGGPGGPLPDLPDAAASVSAEEVSGGGSQGAGVLRGLVLAHLRRVTSGPVSRFEIARALAPPGRKMRGERQVQAMLEQLEAEGLAVRVIGPADEYDSRPVTRWRAGE